LGLVASLNRLLPPYDYSVLDVINRNSGPRNMFVQSHESGDIMLVLAAGVHGNEEVDVLVHVHPEEVAAYKTGEISLRTLFEEADPLYQLTRPALAFTTPQIHEVEPGDIPISWLSDLD
jgi:hypothetical protein